MIGSANDSIRPHCWRCNDGKRLETPLIPRFLPCTCEAAQNSVEHVVPHHRVQSQRPRRAA